MAEYTEVIKQFKRMCAHGNCRTATGCPMNGCNISQCRRFGFERPAEFEQRVMQWAAEHPEPVYPMWCEWLAEKGVVDVARMPVDYYGRIVTEIKPSGKMYEPIPAELAQKLGIEPKEG